MSISIGTIILAILVLTISYKWYYEQTEANLSTVYTDDDIYYAKSSSFKLWNPAMGCKG